MAGVDLKGEEGEVEAINLLELVACQIFVELHAWTEVDSGDLRQPRGRTGQTVGIYFYLDDIDRS